MKYKHERRIIRLSKILPVAVVRPKTLRRVIRIISLNETTLGGELSPR